MFPFGAAGAALLLLRVCAASMLVLIAFWGPQTSNAIEEIVVVLIALSLCIGLFTPPSCVVACLIECFWLTGRSGSELCVDLLFIGVTASLSAIGPGAFSLDARRFGRRIIRARPR